LSLAFAAVACADTIWVPDDHPCIQDAIDAANPGDTVVVRDGVWTGPCNKNLDFSHGLPDGETRAISVRSENGPNCCIIDCENDGRGFYFHSGETNEAMVCGFTISNGSGVVPDNGGGILCESSTPMVVNCVFSGNWSTDGGGMYNLDSSPKLINCTFIANRVSEGTNSDGAGMRNANSSPTLVNCTFSQNTAERFGGGMANADGSYPTVSNCILWGNVDDADGDAGGPFTDESAQIHDEEDSATTVCYSCIQGLDAFAGCGNIGDDPLLTDRLHLSTSSPCIDAGDTTVVLSLGVFGDLDGYARVVDDPLTADTGIPAGLLNEVVDMGAYEYKYRIPGDVDGDGDVDQSDLGILLANWGMGCF